MHEESRWINSETRYAEGKIDHRRRLERDSGTKEIEEKLSPGRCLMELEGEEQ